jgi:hypothetical protein
MAIKIQGTTIINDQTAYIDLAGTTAVKVPAGTTGQQPTGVLGQLRYNTTTNSFEGYSNAGWGSIGGGGGAGTDEFARTIAFLGL